MYPLSRFGAGEGILLSEHDPHQNEICNLVLAVVG